MIPSPHAPVSDRDESGVVIAQLWMAAGRTDDFAFQIFF
jgi:hypothetical protein